MIVNGREIASEILKDVKNKREGLPALIVRAITMAPTAATESYLSTKSARAAEAGMTLEVVRLADTANTNDVLQELERDGADAVLIQLPLPASIDTKQVLNAIPLVLDADVLSDVAHEAFGQSASGALLPPVVGAVREVLTRAGVTLAGVQAVVVGDGWLVGNPVATWLRQQGALVSVVTLEQGNLSELQDADIVVSGAGVGGLITPNLLKKGVVLIDAGTSESGGTLMGDATPACAEVASVFTPVPGGIGPIAVACLFQNAARLVGEGGE